MTYEITDIPQSENCQHCVPCTRMRLMEMGFMKGEKIEISEKKFGLYIVDILMENGHVVSTIALREEELDRICYKGVL